jgi:hypothetical protein
MRILKKTPQELVVRHRQPGRWLVAGCCLLVSIGAIIGATLVPNITCLGGKTIPSCTLTYRSFTGLTLERNVQLEAAHAVRSCSFSRKGRASCKGSYNIIITTNIGNFKFPGGKSTELADKANKFIKNPSENLFQIQSSVVTVMGQLRFFLFLILVTIMLNYASVSLREEQIYISKFNKTKDWASITYKKISGKPSIITTEFPVSAIVDINLQNNYLVLSLKSEREVCIAVASWGKKITIEDSINGSTQVHQSLENARQLLITFLEI